MACQGYPRFLEKTAFRLIEIIRMYFDTSLKTSRRDYSGLSGPGWAVHRKGILFSDGFLNHTRLGLVGWISYWSSGDSALAVDILVVLINTLGLTELVSDALASRKQKEADTNAKIVDLFKDALDEIKNCRCTEALCEEVVQLLVHGMLACAWPRTRIQVLWTESHGGRL